MLSDKRKEMKIESVRIQQEFLAIVQTRHRLWAKDTGDPEIASLHHDIVELLRQIKEPYDKLLNIYMK